MLRCGQFYIIVDNARPHHGKTIQHELRRSGIRPVLYFADSVVGDVGDSVVRAATH